tara:strand:+ start:94890 stop:95645 length:756 start_codon:yes stop_codon:yes gene_type:complete
MDSKTTGQPLKSAKAVFYREEQHIPIVLSFIAAFVDVVCYIALFRTFTAFVTGTLIILAAEIIHPDELWIMKVIVVFAFILSLFFWLIFMRQFKQWKYLRVVVLTMEAVLLGVFMLSGFLLSPLSGADSPETILVALFAVFAMAFQNAAMVQIFHQHVPTTVMTGNFVRFAISVIDIFGSGQAYAEKDKDAVFKTRSQLRHYCYVLAAFSAGALMGAIAYDVGGFFALICPVLILTALALYLWPRWHDSDE